MVGPTSASLQTTITDLKAAIAAGSTITAAQINSLISCWNSFNNHYHTVPDQWWEAYGNTSPYGTSYDNNPENTSASLATSADISTTVASGDDITASLHQTLRSSILSGNDHYHSIDDRTGA
jgi:hypothetical protein